MMASTFAGETDVDILDASATVTCGGSSLIGSEETVNQERCQQILECKRQIEFWTNKLAKLGQEQNKRIKLARLRVDADNYWDSLTEDEQRSKEFILAALQSEELPEDFDGFSSNTFPSSIRNDRDIFLARVAREDFASEYQHDRLFVPPKLRADKEVILKIIPKHPAVVESMACSLRDDEDVFLALLSNEELPRQFLQHFSGRIRSDHDLMLKLCAHCDGMHSMSFIHQFLRNSKEFMLEAIQVYKYRVPSDLPLSMVELFSDTPHILRHASQRLKDDYDVVLAAVQRCGSNLKYASYNVRRNKTIILAATDQNALSFRYCLPGHTKDDCLSDRSFLLERLATYAPNELLRISKSCFDDLSADRNVLLSMLDGGLDWVHVPECWQNDEAFVAEAVQRNPKLFLEIAEHFQEIYKIAFGVIQVENVDAEIPLLATEMCPMLLSDRDAMLAIAKNQQIDVVMETLRYSPIDIRGDKEIMLEAVKNDPRMFEFVSDDLTEDRDIVIAAVRRTPSALHMLNEDFQRANPDIVVSAIRESGENDFYTILDDVAIELWENYDVVRAWLSMGGEWLDWIDSSFNLDEDLLLIVARENWEDFWEAASPELRSNKGFMLKAVAIESRLIDAAEDGLRHDYDLALLAISQSHLPVGYYFNDEGNFSSVVVDEHDGDAWFIEDFEFLVSFTQNVRKRIEEHDTFRDVVVANIYKADPSSTISVLNQGPETIKSHARLFSAFLGLPDEKEVDMLRRASANLLKWGL